MRNEDQRLFHGKHRTPGAVTQPDAHAQGANPVRLAVLLVLGLLAAGCGGRSDSETRSASQAASTLKRAVPKATSVKCAQAIEQSPGHFACVVEFEQGAVSGYLDCTTSPDTGSCRWKPDFVFKR
jgi:hypothetical protein